MFILFEQGCEYQIIQDEFESLDSLDSFERLTECYIRIVQLVSSVYVISVWMV